MTRSISCSGGLLYAQGGFYDDPSILRSPDHRHVPTVVAADETELLPGYDAKRGVPASRLWGLDEDRPAFVGHMEEIERRYARGAPTRLVRLRDVFVHENSIYAVRDNEVLLVHESELPRRPEGDAKRPTAAELRGSSVDLGLADPIFVGSSGWRNYGHWLVDDLMRLLAFGVHDRRAATTTAAVLRMATPALDKIKLGSLALLPEAIADRVVFRPTGEVLHFGEVRFITPSTRHPYLISPDGSRMLGKHGRDLGSTRSSEDRTRPTTIFVRRDARHGRVLGNEDDILDLVRLCGFTPIEPERMSFAEQVATFAAADFVIGVMGAAMTNIVFCRPGTTVLCLAPKGWVEPFYWNLAAMTGLRYGAVYGPSQPDMPPPSRNFRINPHLLTSALRSLR